MKNSLRFKVYSSLLFLFFGLGYSTAAVAQVPTPDVTGDTVICLGSSTTLTASVPDPTNVTYTWFLSGNPFPVFTGNPFTTPPLLVTTVFEVQAFNTVSEETSARRVVTVYVSPSANLDVPLATPADLILCNGDSTTYTASSTLGYTIFHWYDAAAGGNLLHTGTTYNTGPLSGAPQLYVQSENIFGCLSNRTAAVPVTVTPVLDVATVNPPSAAVCSGDSATFTASSLLGGVNFAWYDTLTGGTPIFTGSQFSTGTLTNNSTNGLILVYYVEVFDGNGCRSLRTPATVFINPALDLPVADPAVSQVCSGDSVTLNATSLLNSPQFFWYDSITGGNLIYTGIPFTTDPIVNNGTTNLSTTYYVEVADVNNCRSPRTPAVIVSRPAVDAPVVTPPTTSVCAGDSVTFTASSLFGNSTFAWYDSIAGGNLLFTGNPFNTGALDNSGATDLLRSYYVEAIDTNGCRSVRSSASVVITPQPDLPVATPAADTICSGGSAEFVASSILNSDVFNWYDAVSGGNLLFTGDTFNTGTLINNGGVSAVKNFYLESSDTNGCRSARVPVSVLVLPALDVPLVDPPADTICPGTQATFTATSLLGSPDFNWYDDATSGTPVFTGDTFVSPVRENTGSTSVIYNYYVEAVDANGCRSLRTAATVVVLPATDLVLVDPPADTICSGDSAMFTASMLTGGDGTFNWYDAPTGGNLLYSGNPYNTGSLTNNGGTSSVTTFYVEGRNSSGCSSARTPASVVVLPAVDAVLVNPMLTAICSGDTAVLTASTLLGSEDHFEWYDNASGGNLLFSGNPFYAGPIINQSGQDFSAVFYAEAVSAEGCRSTRTGATVVIAPAVDVPVVTPSFDIICSGGAAQFVASTLLMTGTTFHWYDSPVGGNLIYTGDTFNTGAINNTSLVDLYRFYYVEAEDAAGCRSVRNSATVLVKPAMDIPVVDPLVDTICAGGSGEFTATSVLGSAVEFYWYDQPTGGSVIFTGDTFNTGPVQNPGGTSLVYDYYVEARDNAGCTTVRTAATLLVRPAVEIPIVDPSVDTICSGQSAEFTASTILGTGVSFNWYDSLNSAVPVFTGNPFNTGELTSTASTDVTRFYFVETVDTMGCASVRVPAVVIITPALDFPIVDPPLATVCSGDSVEFTASSALGTGANYNWYDAVTGGNLLFSGNPFNTGKIENNSTTDITTVYYVELENAMGCKSLRNGAVVVTTPAVAVPVVTPPVQAICSGDSAEFVAQSLLPVSEFRWYDALQDGNLLFVGDTFNTGVITNNGPADLSRNYFVEAVDSNGCTSIRVMASLVIRPGLNVPIVSPPVDTICNGGSAEFTATTIPFPSTFNWYDEVTGGNLLFTGDTFNTGPITSNSNTDITRIFYVEAQDTAGCRSVRVPAVVVITPAIDVVLVDPPVASICSGDSATFTAASLLDSNATYNWYLTFSGGTPVFTGNPFNTGQITNSGATDLTRTYYVEAQSGEGCRSLRSPALVVIRPAIDLPVVDPLVDVVCNGQSAEFAASSLLMQEAEFFWYDVIAGGTPIHNGDTFVTGPLYNNDTTSVTRTYYAELVDSAGCRSLRVPVAAVIRPALDVPFVNPPVDTVCSGRSATFIATSLLPGSKTFNWYVEITGGTPVFTGDTFVTEPQVNSTSTDLMRMYFVDVTDSSGCVSVRVPATVIITPAPDFPVVDPAVQSICSGDSATFVATSALGSGVRYNWYDNQFGGTLLFTGDTFNTGPVTTTNTSAVTRNYYVELETAEGCRSFRNTATLVIEVNPDILLLSASDPTICEGQSDTLTAISTLGNDTIRWYTQLEGGEPVFVGDTFVTGPLNETTTFFAASVSDSSGCESRRFAITITVGDTDPLPAPSVVCSDPRTEDVVTFSWEAVPGADAYEVSTDGGNTWKNPSSGPTGLSHTEARTSADQVGVSLIVRAVRFNTECGPREGVSSVGTFCPFVSEDFADIYNSFSPNGDGSNDTWFISDGIATYRNNEVLIFNRWGQKVFEMTGYDNDKKVFTGDGLEDGAYFYIVRIPELGIEKTGYVMIIR